MALTYLAFVARAVVETLEEYPILNSSVEGDEIVFHDDVNLGIAVALDSGLIVPVIPRPSGSLEGMAVAIADVAARARDRKLTPDEVQAARSRSPTPASSGRCWRRRSSTSPRWRSSISRRSSSDHGGGERGAGRHRDQADGVPALSWDHRALDGADAARFLGAVKEKLETGAVR